MQRVKAERTYRLSDEFFYNVIKVYGNMAGRIKAAIDTLFDMPSFGCRPSVRTFNFVLNLLVCAQLFDVVHEVYVGAPKLGIAIDACCLNILIKGLCKSGNMDAAFYVLDEFPKQKCMPNVRTYSTLMRGLCENGRVEEAIKLLDRMESEGIDADTITFNVLISGLRKQGRVEEGVNLLNGMKRKGCEPDAGSYHEVLYTLLDAKKIVEAKELMSRMILVGASPSFVSYKKLIHGLCEEKLPGDVDWALKQMVKQGFVPKMGMWKQILWSTVSRNDTASCIVFDTIIGNYAGGT
ncbi:putative pentatricopeptide repeat-containing protein [Tripterygium wilfordii]|uniref:Putative pentatricopeptide repeat-containing protein n=2 Tax=Tripterygium wilfordii TaxID=458696 RepID=A0A7J7CMJ0_TRIWF|nr:putative pentatricopeptide repeat-containing protein [Tripterygium wilfordii]